MKPRIGFWKYDLFPHIVHNKFVRWSDEGDPQTESNQRFKKDSMILSLPEDEAQWYVEAVDKAKQNYQEKEKRLRDNLLAQLYAVAPHLKPVKEVKK